MSFNKPFNEYKLSFSLGKTFLQDLIGHFLLIQGMDLLATPDTVNLLLLLLLESRRDPPIWCPKVQEPQVLILKNFASVNTHPRNSVRTIFFSYKFFFYKYTLRRIVDNSD